MLGWRMALTQSQEGLVFVWVVLNSGIWGSFPVVVGVSFPGLQVVVAVPVVAGAAGAVVVGVEVVGTWAAAYWEP